MTLDKLITISFGNLGALKIQINWGNDAWYYTTHKKEKVNLTFFMGSVEDAVDSDSYKLYQIVIGRLLISWGWKAG